VSATRNPFDAVDLAAAFRSAAAHGEVVMVVTVSNACPR